ncbi:aspartyl/asparaginyl beta-hydroxylase domain-containing protein [Streptomyces sp. CB01881]|uniref:aspartyl/asparaginyl beta-hydroxylase domain-containing protein n=1 Tax=Streptomyces sp. CB01881 TaxID=2078691 RepID=UPI000CDBD815|nr:aspartyl/asparaginyl beta-hydroxylase domain-containing protein [Streptomyces sp. CB01881]AUY52409.1 aspartyl/asparaginyl beta-hydroxylase domain-containing protein [Streptomyces sp. CB01881]TYC71835.1 aspartyl/asparaginyl beta-hydroxylase domain-containing protein [Streptomyces sp. CB01881]
MSSLPDVVRLLPSFDAERLQADLESVKAHFIGHANPTKAYSDEGDAGGWGMLPLRIPGGDPDRVGQTNGGREEFADTPYMKSTPYIREILDSLRVPLRGVRLSAHEAGAVVQEHIDRPYGLEIGWVRLHIPIQTNDRAVFFVNGKPNRWKPGEFWYANIVRPHRLINEGDERRIHLLIDCYISKELFELFPEADRVGIKDEDVIFYQQEQPLPEELSGLSGTLRMPASFINQFPDDPSEAQWHAEDQPEVEGKLEVQDGRIVLWAAGRGMAFAHLGNSEFRPLCWSKERTMTLDSRDGRAWATFRCRRGSKVVETARQQPLLQGVTLPTR